jgi:hypothetical protein
VTGPSWHNATEPLLHRKESLVIGVANEEPLHLFASGCYVDVPHEALHFIVTGKPQHDVRLVLEFIRMLG